MKPNNCREHEHQELIKVKGHCPTTHTYLRQKYLRIHAKCKTQHIVFNVNFALIIREQSHGWLRPSIQNSYHFLHWLTIRNENLHLFLQILHFFHSDKIGKRRIQMMFFSNIAKKNLKFVKYSNRYHVSQKYFGQTS